ncbi:MAG: histidine kinase [Crocinitomicaceae bacterium]|nr:histidine kinase [Crocinitomicaceae bacterium]
MKRYVQYSLLAWVFFAGVILWLITGLSDFNTASIRTSSFVVPQIILFYLNLNWLGPRFNSGPIKANYLIILLALIAIHVLCFAPLDMWLDEYYPIDIRSIQDRPTIFIIFGRFMSSIPPLIISALIWKSYLLQKQSEESLELKNKMLHAETKALKAQINPHFLFNSLNNIYSLTQMKSDKAGDAILSLSEMLRFVTYESQKDFVSLDDEVQQIENFISLQKLKDDDQSNIRIGLPEDRGQYKIAPMLLLPLIENAFKHSNIENKEEGYIAFEMRLEKNELVFELKNSRACATVKKDNVGGVGLENVKKRLALIYPEKHTLGVNETPSAYELNLRINLD